MKFKWLTAFLLIAISTAAYADDTDNFVLPEHITKYAGDSYAGTINVSFKNNSGVLSARIETNNLILVSLTMDQLANYTELFTDPQAVALYADGQPWTSDAVAMAVSGWVARWETQEDPFSAFAIFENTPCQAFVGHIVIGHGSRYGQSELALLLLPEYHNIYYATQAVTAILYGYVPNLVSKEYLVNLNNSAVESSPLRSVHSTTHFDDTFYGQALIRSGMQIGESDILWGSQRFHYLIRKDDILSSNILRGGDLGEGDVIVFDDVSGGDNTGADSFDSSE